MAYVHGYKFRSNSDLRLAGDLRQMLAGVIAYGIQFGLNLYLRVSSLDHAARVQPPQGPPF